MKSLWWVKTIDNSISRGEVCDLRRRTDGMISSISQSLLSMFTAWQTRESEVQQTVTVAQQKIGYKMRVCYS